MESLWQQMSKNYSFKEDFWVRLTFTVYVRHISKHHTAWASRGNRLGFLHRRCADVLGLGEGLGRLSLQIRPTSNLGHLDDV